MANIVILISTRRYLRDSELFKDIQSNSLDDFVVNSSDLDRPEDINRIKFQCKGDDTKRKELLAQNRRLRVWSHDDAAYNNNDFQFSGLAIRKTIEEITDGESQYVVYIAPCTNGKPELDYRRKYTEELTTIVNNDSGNAGNYYLIVHDRDISNDYGHGICKSINNFHTYKFQHEDDDPICPSIIQLINEPSLELCKKICSILEAAFMRTLSKLNGNEATAAAYENLMHQV